MEIEIGYDIEFEVDQPTAHLALLYVHPDAAAQVLEPEILTASPDIAVEEFIDDYGNRCTRFLTPPGRFSLHTRNVVRVSGEPDTVEALKARQHGVEGLPIEVLRFLLSSRYCEADLLSAVAWDLFGNSPLGWRRVQAVCSWVNQKIRFDYTTARPTKTAMDVFTERVGVCRDFQHLAIALCRSLNIPARYATGYLGDIGIPPSGPMDFSAWFEAYLDGRWWTFDARHNHPRIGRVLMARGRDAADAALTTSFGPAQLLRFDVITNKLPEIDPVTAAAAV